MNFPNIYKLWQISQNNKTHPGAPVLQGDFGVDYNDKYPKAIR